MAPALQARALCALPHLWTMEFEVKVLCLCYPHYVCTDTIFKKEVVVGSG